MGRNRGFKGTFTHPRELPFKDSRFCYTRLENDYKDQIHYETARQSRSALGIGLIIRQK